TATAGDAWLSVGVPVPVASGVAVTFALITTPPATPAGALCMWPSVTVVPAGNPVRFATKVTVAAVTLPPLVVVSKVMVAVPVPDDSALVIGGTSFDGSRVAVNVGFVGVDGDVELPQPAAMNASAIS